MTTKTRKKSKAPTSYHVSTQRQHSNSAKSGSSTAPRGWTLMTPSGDSQEIPEALGASLIHILSVYAKETFLMLIPVTEYLTSQQAARVLGMSRQHLVRLLNQGKIAHIKVGTHHRLKIADVVAYQTRVKNERKAMLTELTRISQLEWELEDQNS